MQIIYGINSVLTAIEQNIKIKKLYVTSKNLLRFSTQIKEFSYEVKSFNELNQLAHGSKHQGIVAVITYDSFIKPLKPVLSDLSALKKATVVIFDRITDVGNFGAMLRTCAFFNVDAVFYLTRNQAPFNSKIFQAAAGAISMLNLVPVSNINSLINALKKMFFWVFAAVAPSEQSKSVINFDFLNYSKTALIVGNEHDGIRPLICKNSDFNLHIPNQSQTKEQHLDSLNVNAALSIFLYEMCK